jgi:predicted PurR-regulated permease PerM
MAKSLIVGVFGCLEYAIVFLFVASLAFAIAQGMDKLVPWTYDYSADENLAEALRQGFESKQITRQQGEEIFLAYQDNQTRLQRLRSYILYAVSVCISAVVSVLLFKKYRLLRFRERFRDYFFPSKP